MPNFVFKVNNYTNTDAVYNLVNYICSSDYFETSEEYCCFTIPGYNLAESVTAAFNACKIANMQTDGKLVQHIIMGLGDLDGVNEAGVRVLADMVAKYFLQRGYQVFWGSHYSSDNADWAYRHVHFAVNTVNLITGKRLPISDSDLGALCAFMRSYWPQCNWRAERKKSFFVDYSKEVYPDLLKSRQSGLAG